MFCPECGTNNADQAQFCEKCGTKLEQPVATPVSQPDAAPAYNQAAPTAPREPRKPMSMTTKVILIVALALIVLGTSGFFVLKSITNPKNIVTDYAKSYVSHDAKSLFKTLGFEESPFITAANFEKALKSDTDAHFADASDYTIEENETSSSSKENKTLNYNVTFRDSSNAFEYNTRITLTKQSTKSFLFFDNWKIKPDSFLAKDLCLQVPAGSEVTLDGVTLDSKYMSESEDEKYVSFCIPYLFSGDHTYTVTQTNFNDYEGKFTSDARDYQKSNIASVDSYNMTLSDAVADSLIETSKTTLQNIYTAALDKKDFADAITPTAIEADSLSTMTDSYNTFVENNVKGDTHLKKVEFKAIDGSAQITSNYSDNDDCFAVMVTLDVSYTTSSVVKSFWDGKKSNKTYDGESSLSFTYHYRDGKWVLNNTGALSNCVYYSRY